MLRSAPLTFLFVLLLIAPRTRAQVLIGDSLMQSLTSGELMAQGVFGAQYGVQVHRLIYHTVDAHGAPTQASGALVVPVGPPCIHPLAAYMHGTIMHREEVPSRLSSEITVGYFLGGSGYVAAMPDYLGLGDGPGPHPYVHAASEATASIDMMRAAREFCAQHGVALNGQVFLAGYSQGGHACMATHRMIEEQFAEEFTITASAPCSGPYDLSGVQAEVMAGPDPYPAPYYLPYVVLAYGHVYPDMYTDIAEIFKEPWATALPPLFQGDNGAGPVNAIMPDVPSQILQDDLLAAFNNDPDHFFREALRANDLYDWTPQAPLRMVYCEADDHVFHENSLVALAAMQANGAPQVEAVSAGATLDHGGCALPSLLGVKAWFDGLRAPCEAIGVEEFAAGAWSLHPNPAHDRVQVIAPGMADGPLQWTLHAADGRPVAGGRAQLVQGTARVDLPVLAPGGYVWRAPASGMRGTRLMVY
ncbi:MAG: lipase family protein [Flavobacteriales bacterium]|jgi:hypothetical protein|nr:lipase family protein [Flavobacteriales bacterium]